MSRHGDARGGGPVSKSQSPRPAAVTARQLEVLALLATGHTYAEAARALWIEVSTLKNHLAAARLNLRAGTTVHAVVIAVHYGLIIWDYEVGAYRPWDAYGVAGLPPMDPLAFDAQRAASLTHTPARRLPA